MNLMIEDKVKEMYIGANNIIKRSKWSLFDLFGIVHAWGFSVKLTFYLISLDFSVIKGDIYLFKQSYLSI